MFIGSEIMQTSVRDVVYVVFRHKWKIAFVFLLVLVGVTAYSYLWPAKYRSDAKLLIRLGRENVTVDPSVQGPTMPVITTRDGEVKSEVAILTSQSLAEEIVDSLGVDTILKNPPSSSDKWYAGLVSAARGIIKTAKDQVEGLLITAGLRPSLTDREKAIQRVSKSISVEVEKQSSILDVSVGMGRPDLAQSVLNKLIELYLPRHIEVFSSQASPEFFQRQVDQLRDELTQKEAALDAFRREHSVVNLDGENEKLLQHISNLENQLTATQSEVQGSGARVAALEKALGDQSQTTELSRTTGRTNYAADAIKDKLADLMLKESDLAARYPATHRPLIEMRSQIETLQKQLASEEETRTEVTTGINSNYQELLLALEKERTQYNAFQAQAAVVAADLEQRKLQIGLLAQLKELTRDVQLAEDEYKQYRENLQRSKISVALDLDKVSNVSVVQAATLPLSPISPRRMLNLLLGVAIGLFGGLSLAFLAEFLDDSVNTKEKAERCLGRPVLAAVSEKEYRACT